MEKKYTWRIVQVVEYEVDFHWKKKVFEKAQRAPWVRLIIQDEQFRIFLNNEYRYELDAFDWRLPWWKVFDTLVEYTHFKETEQKIEDKVIDAAKREALEEVWIEVEEVSILWKKVCWTTMERDLWYVLVNNFSVVYWSLENEEWEHISEWKWFSFAEIKELIVTWDIQEWRSISVLCQIIFSSEM